MTQRQPKPKTQNPKPVEVDFTEVRTGEDTRQRGWFWHWNELHTEYEPLLKHSGIGLITSYIVWTDRREHSPYHGYAFPSLQSQAAFSGSDRAELITINRILVALDLIEIRKEMILRADAQGHRWRVPHNLYRVKDRSGSPHLTAADVEQVMTLAEERKEVYRHIRHIFTSGFVPISRDNIWHGILEELRPTELWQRLATQAGEEEARFSQRSRTGHANRKSNAEAEAAEASETGTSGKRQLKSVPEPVDSAEIYVPGITTETGISPVTVVSIEGEQSGGTSVAQSNTGSETSVAASNEGLDDGFGIDGASMDGQSNGARPSSVAPSNSMYDQSIQTTRTNDGGLKKEDVQARNIPVTDPWDFVTFPVTTPTPTLSQVPTEAIPHQAPEHGPDRQAALVAFAEANERQATAAEIRLLGGIATEINGDGGWAIVTAAIYEAVDSGSAFVAPKRVREIVRRWQREGLPDGVGESRSRGVEKISGVGGEGLGSESLAGSRSVPNIDPDGRAQGTAPTGGMSVPFRGRHRPRRAGTRHRPYYPCQNPKPKTRNPIAVLDRRGGHRQRAVVGGPGRGSGAAGSGPGGRGARLPQTGPAARAEWQSWVPARGGA